MRVRPYATYARVWIRAGWKIAVGTAGLAATGVGVAAGTGEITVAGGILVAGAAAALLSDVGEVRRELGDLYTQPVDLDPRSLTLPAAAASARLVELPHGSALVDDDLCEWLASVGSVPARVLDMPYCPPRRVGWAAEKAVVEAWRAGRRDFDAAKVRLASDLRPDGDGAVALQPTRFVYARITNDLAAHAFWSRRERVVQLGPQDVPFPGGRVPGLAESQASNHVGADTLTFLRTGELVIAVQSTANSQSPGLLAASGSGSADWSDLVRTGGTDLLAFLRRTMSRELREECGLSPSQVDEPATRIIGFARFLHRGGKPQFFGWTPTAITEHDLGRSRVERRYVDDHFLVPVDWTDAGTWAASLREFLVAERHRVSVPLHLNVELLVRWVERRPDRLDVLRRPLDVSGA